MAAAALRWLEQMDLGHGVPALAGDRIASTSMTAKCAAALWSYGQRDQVRRCLTWLLDQQLECGAFADRHGGPSLAETAAALAALNELADAMPAADEALARGCDWLAAWIDEHGTIHRSADGRQWTDRQPLVADIICLPPLAAAARRLGQHAWRESAARALARYRRSVDLTRWQVPSAWLAAAADALVDLGQPALAREALLLPAALQRRDGSVPVLPGASWVSSEGVARLAEVWFKLDDRQHGDRALAALHARQRADGGFSEGWGRGAPRENRPSVATACHVLSASLAQVRATFEATAQEFEATIDPADGRVTALVQSLAHLPTGARVADVGCGKGRFLRALMPQFPHYCWTGIDLSPAMLGHLPDGATAREGNLLRLDEPDGHYDAAFAVESLEHALLPEQAVRELMRIVKPGGRVIILDKNRKRQPLSIHDPWEQWFSPAAVEAWLRAGCQEIEVSPIRHGNAHQTGLFLCWTARRLDGSHRRAA
jgi:SAM-dependent methyltransferase